MSQKTQLNYVRMCLVCEINHLLIICTCVAYVVAMEMNLGLLKSVNVISTSET